MELAASPGPGDMTGHEIRQLVNEFWAALGRRDFDAVGAMMAPEGHYIDVPLVGGEDGAYGPAEVAARLRLGIEPLAGYVLQPGTVVIQGDTAITEHAEQWTWTSGEQVLLRFCSVQQFRAGKVVRWWDYVDLSTLLNAAPSDWLEHIMAGYK